MRKLLLLLALCMALLSSFALRPTADGYQVGDKAADFHLKNVHGEFVSLANYPAAKDFIVVFTCNTCPFAKAYENRVIALDAEYAPQGYPVIAINPNDAAASPGDSYAAMQQLTTSHHYSFAYLQDESQQAAHQYGATRTPHLFVLQRQGPDLRVAYVGAIDDNSEDAKLVKTKYLDNAMSDLLASKLVATQAIGCSIRWKKA